MFGLTEESILLPGRHGGSCNIIYGTGVLRQHGALVAVYYNNICHLN